MKPRREADFVYDAEEVGCVIRKNSRVEFRQTQSFVSDSTSFNSGKHYVTSSNWSDIKFLATGQNNDHQLSREGVTDNSSAYTSQSRGISSEDGREKKEEEEFDFLGFVNTTVGNYRKSSSTRYNFLDFDNNFWTASSEVLSDSSAMSGNGEEAHEMGCICKTCESQRVGSACGDKVMESLFEKIDALTKSVSGLQGVVTAQAARLEKLEDSSRESGQESIQSKVKGKSKSKSERVAEEKERQYKMLQEKFKGKFDYSDSSSEDECLQNEATSLKGIRKNMSSKQKKLCENRVQDTLKKVGAVFPEDDVISSSTSGKDSSDAGSCRHRRKVKSGAKVIKRPVIKTELWPHTVANENDGDQVTCDNISLAKFMSCFTYIMATCASSESRGRSVLLHAISLVLEYLQWPEARTFHNVMLTKIEQGRLKWSEDFAALAEEFVDKKVRLSLKPKFSGSYSGGSFNKGSGNGKGFRNSSQRGGFGRSKPVYGAICYQWNFGTCSYGEDCKRWHVCKTCGEAGKLGERHKASSHETSGGRSRPRT